MRRLGLIGTAAVVLAAACGGPPLLAGVPQPNTAKAAGVAAAVAGAATLADPQGAARRAEANKPVEELRPQRSGGEVPSDVLDRLDSPAAAPPPDAPPPLRRDPAEPVPGPRFTPQLPNAAPTSAPAP